MAEKITLKNTCLSCSLCTHGHNITQKECCYTECHNRCYAVKWHRRPYNSTPSSVILFLYSSSTNLTKSSKEFFAYLIIYVPPLTQKVPQMDCPLYIRETPGKSGATAKT